jgi:hypothetical protein
MNGSVVISLPHGFSAAGMLSREAGLRELTDQEQLFLVEDCQALPAAAWTTEALAQCVTRLGARAQPDRGALRALTVGDRDALLLHLHALSFGEAIHCATRCPAQGCGEMLDLGLAVRDLLLPVYANSANEYELQVAGETGEVERVRFRLPTGEDHEIAAGQARSNVDTAVAELLRRCVLSGDAPPRLTRELSARMAELDPQAELLLSAHCPACGNAFRARFDAATILRQRLEERVQDLYREVHLLAFHYHWSMHDILAMGARARRRYLRLLQAEITRGTLQ